MRRAAQVLSYFALNRNWPVIASVNAEDHRHYGTAADTSDAINKNNVAAAPHEPTKNSFVKKEMCVDIKELGEQWGPIVKKFLKENSLKQAEHDEFLDKRVWFEQLVQGFDLISCLPPHEQEELQSFFIEYNNNNNNNKMTSEGKNANSTQYSSAEVINEYVGLPSLRPRVLMFGSCVVGTAFVNGDVDFALAFPCSEFLGHKINMMQKREAAKLEALRREAERIAKEDEAAEAMESDERRNSGENTTESNTVVKVRCQRGPQVLPVSVNVSIVGIYYKFGFVQVERVVQPHLLSMIHDFIQSNREGMILNAPSSLENGEGPGTSVDPLTVAGVLDEEVGSAPIKEDKTNANEEVTIAAMGGVTSVLKSPSKNKSKILRALEDDPNISLIDEDNVNNGKEPKSDKFVLHRIFRARVPIMQFCPPRVGTAPMPTTLGDALDRSDDVNSDIKGNDNTPNTRTRFMKKVHSSSPSSSASGNSTLTDDLVSKLISDDIKMERNDGGNSSSTSDDPSKRVSSPDTFSSIFNCKSPKSGIGAYSVTQRGQEESPPRHLPGPLPAKGISMLTCDSRLSVLSSKRKEHFDVSLCLTGCENSLLLRRYMETYPELRVSSMVVKHWGRKRHILNARRGWLSPYALTILFIHYMERCGAISLISIDSVCTTFELMSKKMLDEERRLYSGPQCDGTVTKKYGRLYGIPQFDKCLSHPLFEDDSGSLTDPSSCNTDNARVVLPTLEQHFQNVPKYLQGFFEYYSDESQFDFDKDVVDIRDVMPSEPSTAVSPTVARDDTFDDGNMAIGLGDNTLSHNIHHDGMKAGNCSMIPSTSRLKSWRDYRYNSRADWYRALEEEGLLDHRERWHRLGYETMLIRDPYEVHSLARGTEFFKAEAIREEMRISADMKGGGLGDIIKLLSHV